MDVVNDRFYEAVPDGFDADIRFGSDVRGDMLAVRLGPDVEMMAITIPSYLDA